MKQLAPHERIMQITVNFWQSRALAVAAELELADHLAGGPLSLDELATRSGAKPANLRRLLRALETIGIFQQTATNMYTNSETSEALRRDAAWSQWAWVQSQLSPGYGIYERWAGLASVIRGDVKPEEDTDQGLWDFLRSHPQAGRAFGLAMQGVSQAMTPAVTGAYDWSSAGLIVDIGGGVGTQLVDILEKNPASRGILFDQEYVLAGALQHQRMSIVAGDFFQEVPKEADLYLVRTILHDWDDAKASAILSTIRTAARPQAKLVLAEIVLPEGPEFTLGKWSDLLMGVVFTGAKERTNAEYSALLKRAGWRIEQALPTDSPLGLIIASAA